MIKITIGSSRIQAFIAFYVLRSSGRTGRGLTSIRPLRMADAILRTGLRSFASSALETVGPPESPASRGTAGNPELAESLSTAEIAV